MVSAEAQTRPDGSQTIDGPRLLEIRIEPAVPQFAEPFELRFVIRIPKGTVAFLPDTLLPTYIRKDSPNGAKAFVNEVFRTTRSLETMPERGRRYRVLYEVHPDAV
jgi:hypothetical protein